MPSSKRTILITGCSDGGLGSALAIAFQEAGWRVFASARNVNKLNETNAAGIEAIALDIVSPESVESAVKTITELTGESGLDALLNNAGAGYSMPILDCDIKKMREVFELNVFSNVAMIQAFTPLLLKAKQVSGEAPLIINNTSIVAHAAFPIQAAYNASKAAMSMLSGCLRLEVEPLGIKVVDLKTGAMKTQFAANKLPTADDDTKPKLPANSYYAIARDAIEKFMDGTALNDTGADRHEWAKRVVSDVSRKNPRYEIWRGGNAGLVWLSTFLPVGLLDKTCKDLTGLSEMEKRLKERQ